MKGLAVIVISFVIAMIFMVLPLPDAWNDWRPSVFIMVFIYWCIAMPERFGVGTGWLLGLLYDVEQSVLLGKNALIMACIAYFFIHFYKRFRMFPLVQQSILIGAILLCQLLFTILVSYIIGEVHYTWSYCMSAISSMILWPGLFIVLRNARRSYKVV